jgi:hypothetical protein
VRRRRRYEVVVEGLSGQAAAQRSVVSEHRSEDAAREDARVERNRLEVIYGEAASDWRVVVTRDDEIVWEERPKGTEGPRLAPTPLDPPPPPPPDRGDGGDAAGGAAPPAEPQPGTAPKPGADAEPEPDPDPETSGPVPDWLIERVEQSIARSQERERERNRGD